MEKKDTLVNRQRYTASFDKELLQDLKNLSKETSIPLSKLLDKAIILLKEEFKEK